MSDTLKDRLYAGANAQAPGNALFREAVERIETLERELARYKKLEVKLQDYSDVVDRPDGEGVRPNLAMSILSEWENEL